MLQNCWIGTGIIIIRFQGSYTEEFNYIHWSGARHDKTQQTAATLRVHTAWDALYMFVGSVFYLKIICFQMFWNSIIYQYMRDIKFHIRILMPY